MTINIPLSVELLTWWLKNMKYEDNEFRAPLPIRLDFGGHSIDLASNVELAFDLVEECPYLSGHVSVSSNVKEAQAKMLGLEFVRDKLNFELSPEEKKAITLMCIAANTVAWRVAKDNVEYENLINQSNE